MNALTVSLFALGVALLLTRVWLMLARLVVGVVRAATRHATVGVHIHTREVAADAFRGPSARLP